MYPMPRANPPPPTAVDAGEVAVTGAAAAARRRALSYDELSCWFHVPINAAAQRLGVCVTALKKQCRKHGIARWPHRKLKSLDKLKEKLEKEEATAADKEYYKHEIHSIAQKKEHIFRAGPSTTDPGAPPRDERGMVGAALGASTGSTGSTGVLFAGAQGATVSDMRTRAQAGVGMCGFVGCSCFMNGGLGGHNVHLGVGGTGGMYGPAYSYGAHHVPYATTHAHPFQNMMHVNVMEQGFAGRAPGAATTRGYDMYACAGETAAAGGAAGFLMSQTGGGAQWGHDVAHAGNGSNLVTLYNQTTHYHHHHAAAKRARVGMPAHGVEGAQAGGMSGLVAAATAAGREEMVKEAEANKVEAKKIETKKTEVKKMDARKEELRKVDARKIGSAENGPSLKRARSRSMEEAGEGRAEKTRSSNSSHDDRSGEGGDPASPRCREATADASPTTAAEAAAAAAAAQSHKIVMSKARRYEQAVHACVSLQSAQWATDRSLRVSMSMGAKGLLRIVGVGSHGRKVFDETDDGTQTGVAGKRGLLRDRYAAALRGQRVEWLVAYNKRRFLAVLCPFRKRTSNSTPGTPGDVVGVCGLLVELSETSRDLLDLQ